MAKNKNTNWELVEKTISKKEDSSLSTESISQKLPIKKEAIENPEGIIMKYKLKSIERKAALQSLTLWYNSQFEVAQIQMKTAVEIRSKDIKHEAVRFLADLDRRHLEFLQNIEIRNVQQKMEALAKIGDQTSEMLTHILSRDWPPKMIEETINAITKLYVRFFDKVMDE